MDDINTRCVDMPTTIRSYVVCNKDLTYTIMLNSKLSYEQNMISYVHEMEHIKNGDYERKCCVDLIEIYAHSM